MINEDSFDVMLPFTRDSWRGRIRACRAIGDSLDEADVTSFDQEHGNMLRQIAPPDLEILHYCSITRLKVK
jgi:hypothetical protein